MVQMAPSPGLGILYRPFHTTHNARFTLQPHVTKSKVVLVWDGRLDNRAAVQRKLRLPEDIRQADVAIVAAAYEEWGQACLAEFVGDWALSLWNPHDRSLLLAKDFLGTRHLYYSLNQKNVAWSTVLDPLVLLAGRSYALNEEYIAGCLSRFPAAHLTPYVGIESVPPSSVVVIRNGRQSVRKYWDFDPGNTVYYSKDKEYEEQFRTLFAQAVRRRLEADRPVLAELSGGMDSASIVCMADAAAARGIADSCRLDTLSYYSDAEPQWDERPYFTLVESRRGRAGFHIDLGSELSATFGTESNGFAATPGSRPRENDAGNEFRAYLREQGYRVVLSGTGGDEVAGGVPTPLPELEDYLARGRIALLAHSLKLWSLAKQKPWFLLLLETGRGFLPRSGARLSKGKQSLTWLTPEFVRRNHMAFEGYAARLKWFGPLPSYQENLCALETLRRQIECDPLPPAPSYEKRYPFLDRDLLEFLYGVPRDQIVRPGQRRSLMRRALADLVPKEILNRKRKACLIRMPLAAISMQWESLCSAKHPFLCASLGIVEFDRLSEAIEGARRGLSFPVVTLMRTLAIEHWLRGIENAHVAAETPPAAFSLALRNKPTRSSASSRSCERTPEERR
jgi:asparagine synthase (glutamine-hydrolysing)